MMVKINLLDAKRKQVWDRQLRIEKLFRVFSVLLVFVGLITAGVVGSSVWMSRSIAGLEEQIASKEIKLNSYGDLALQSQLLSRKLNAISEILPQRRLLERKLTLFFDVYKKDLSVSNVDFRGAGDINSIGVSGSVVSVVDYLNLDEEMLALAKEKELERLVVDSLGRDEVGEYRVSYTLSLDVDEVESE